MQPETQKAGKWVYILFGLAILLGVTALIIHLRPAESDQVPRIEPSVLRISNALIIDARPASTYQADHIAGAISGPEAEIASWASKLPKAGQIVVYCQ